MQRTPTAELLDSDIGSPAELNAALRDLENINRWFGGISTTERLVERVARQTGDREFSLLEVAAASGEVPTQAQRRLLRRGIRLQVTLLDRSPAHLDSHRPAVAGDALSLPFYDGSFDLVSSCLFAHHLAPEQITRSADEALRVCRTAVLINDLIRHPAHLLLVYAGLPLFRSPITHHDAVASVRQAYTIKEMHEMLKRSSAARVEITRHYLFRMGVVLWKR
jgi:ubiquinone/menaquinone biosynthesis C-methylase UbiE